LHNRRVLKSVLAVLIAATMILAPSFDMINAGAATLTELKDQQDALEQQKTENDALLAKLKDDTANKKAYRDALNDQITTVREQCDLLVVQISGLDDEITKTESTIEDKQKTINENYEKLKERIKAIYMTGNSTNVSIVLNSSSLLDYTEKSELLKAVSEHDKKLIEDLTTDLNAVQDKLAKIKTDKEELSQRKKQMDAKSTELSDLYTEAQKLFEEAQASEADAQAEAQRIADEETKTEAAIDEWYEQYRKAQAASAGGSTSNLGGSGFVGTGYFIWPMPGYTMITCYFGEGGHRGIDIAGSAIYGKSIIAAASGTVAYAGEMGSYGNVVFIDHGNGYQTRYAHMSAIACTTGQTVGQGDVIGYVGSTGNSTGPHLHFEIIYEDSLQNPFNYF
jgi:murein DD-endopeptidase MepM/ murein hydrolase activator NlpD